MYSYKFDGTAVGKARLEDADASFKDLAEVCANIRGKKVADALELLEKAAAGKYPILYRKYTSKLAHRKELGGRSGRYPKKSAKLVLGTLRSAIASAKAKGLSEDLIVVHAAANKKNVFPRLSPKGGRRTRSYYETARVEVVVREANPLKKPEKAASRSGGNKPAEHANAHKQEAQKAEPPALNDAEKNPEAASAGAHTQVEPKAEAKAKKAGGSKR